MRMQIKADRDQSIYIYIAKTGTYRPIALYICMHACAYVYIYKQRGLGKNYSTYACMRIYIYIINIIFYARDPRGY